MGKKRREKLERRKNRAATPAPGKTALRFSTLGLAIAIVIVAVVATAAFVNARHRSATAGSGAALAPGVFYKSQGHQGHMGESQAYIEHFKYSSNPPTSGAHRETFSKAFISKTPLPKYIQVHLLEHGNVLLQYHCFSCPDVVASLESIAHRFDDRLVQVTQSAPTSADVGAAEEQGEAVIVAPNNDMDSKIALTAWTRLETLDNPDERSIVEFINAYLHNADNIKQ